MAKKSISTSILTGLVRAYQLGLSPFLGGACRFEPTCSHYAIDSLKCHGTLYGSWLSIKRLLRCHPFAKGGFDPVPPARTAKPSQK